MNVVNKETLELIKKYEGFRNKKYLCPAGHYTIGYGHLITKSEHFEEISANEAEQILMRDVKKAAQAVARQILVPLNDNQFGALVSFTYNLGAGALQRSTLRQKVNRGEHELIPQELMKWIYARGKRLKGLLYRRTEEARLYTSAMD